MRRAVLMLSLPALAGVILPVPARANGPAAAGGSCPSAPVPAASTPVGVDGCPGVRPGGRVVTDVGSCTLNFLFRAPDGTRYIGTAGHCVSTGLDAAPFERAWAPGTGPVAEDGEGNRIGEFAYAHQTPPKDFALIRIDPGVEASAEMCNFGAPRGVLTETTGPVVVHYYANGVSALPARSGLALGIQDPDRASAAGLAQEGDGGSGVMTADGLAVGVVVTFGVNGVGFEPGPGGTPSPYLDEAGWGTIGITRLGPQLARASEQLGVPLELVTG